jgi:hypothetical protein
VIEKLANDSRMLCRSCDARHTQALSLQLGDRLYPAVGGLLTAIARTRDGWRLAVGYREFVDNAGTLWRVWDTHPVAANTLRTVSPSYAGGWLTFESHDERRRLTPIPPEWEFASRELMGHWCARASHVRAVPGEEQTLRGTRPGLPPPDS